MKGFTMPHRTLRLSLMATSAFSTVSMLAAVPAHAQGSMAQIEEIVITAEKQTQLLSDTAVAVSVINQQNLDNLDVDSAQELVTTMPNLQTSVNGYSTQFAIRGIGNFSGSYGTVAVQVDGIYEPNIGALDNALYDVGRIEVARGPQGTLYGRNATAGVVNIYTQDPVNEFEAFGDVSYGNPDELTARGVINVPLSDRFQVRGTVVRKKNDGFYPSGAAERKYNAADIWTARLTALAELTDTLEWRLSYEHSENNSTLNYLQGVNYLYYPDANLETGVLGDPVVEDAPRNLMGQESVTDNAMDTHQNSVRSRLTWEASDTLSLQYLAGYSSFVNNGYTSATGVFWSWQNGVETETTSHELDINYTSDKVQSVIGLYYYWDNTSGPGGLHIGNTVPWPLSDYTSQVSPPINNPVGMQPGAYGLIDIVQNTEKNTDTSKAIFSQTTYNVTDRLRVTGGLRYTEDKHEARSSSQVCAWQTVTVPTAALECAVPFGPPSSVAQEAKSDNASWKVRTAYDLTPDDLIFASVSTGYRAGGVSGNAQLPEDLLSYEPETVTNYELGWKSQLFDNTVSTSLALFYMKYTDMQVSAIELDLNDNPTPVTINAAKSTIKGAEFEWDWRVTANDRLTGYITYLDAHFSSFPNATNASVNPDGIYNNQVAPVFGFAPLPTNVPYDFTGNDLPNAPEFSLRLAYSHIFDLGAAGRIIPAVQFYYQTSTYSDFANTMQAKREDYSRSNINLTYESESGQLTVTGFVHNVEDSKVWQSANAKWDETMAFYMPPRTYGVRVGYRF